MKAICSSAVPPRRAARCAAAGRSRDRATGGSRSASRPCGCRSTTWHRGQRPGRSLPSRARVALELAGVGELAGRIPAAAGIGVVADRLQAGADAHHHLVVADHFAVRAGQRDQAHALATVVEGVEDAQRLDAGAGHHHQRALVILFAPAPGRCGPASRRRPCFHRPPTQSLRLATQRAARHCRSLARGEARRQRARCQQDQTRRRRHCDCRRPWRRPVAAPGAGAGSLVATTST